MAEAETNNDIALDETRIGGDKQVMINALLKSVLRSSAVQRLAQTQAGRRAFFQLASSFTPMLCNGVGPIRYYLPTNDNVIGRSVFIEGHFDGEIMDAIIERLRSLGISSLAGRTFIDIGANIGTSSLPAVMKYGFARAISFEPDPSNFRLLADNVRLNRVEDRVTCMNLALSNVPGKLKLARGGESGGNSRVVEGGEAGDTIEIEATTFDRLVEDGRINLDEIGLIWMDVEGHEGYVLGGATKLLERKIPLLTEYAPTLLQKAKGMEAFHDLLARSSYSSFIDIRSKEVQRPISEIASLAKMYEDPAHFTDLLFF